ncbi:PPE family protein [Mycobacterium kyorinense]|nr:PPE family protein [Mycobacterium kyorinense]
MDFAVIPPEINSARMYSGPGSGPMLAAAAAWDALAADLHSTAISYGAEISSLTTGWRGPASASMTSATASYLGWMTSTAAQAEQAGTQAKAAAVAYDAAFAMTVPPPVIAANRSLLMSLIATNFLGQNTPAIAATEAHYTEMWAQDAAAMYGYAGASAAASTLTPFTEPPPATNAVAPAVQAAAVTHAVGTSTPTTLSQLMSTIPQALQGLSSPMSSATSTSGSSGLLGELFPDGLLGSGGLGLNNNLWNTIFSSGFYSPGNLALCDFLALAGIGAATSDAASAVEGAPGVAAAESALGSGALGSLGGLGGLGEVAAGVGRAATIGPLSVPPSWAPAVPAISPPAPLLGGTPLTAPPAVAAGMPPVPLGGAAGHGINGTAPRYGFRPTVVAHPPAAG